MTKFKDHFDVNVWRVVANIPAGQVMGYGEVAKAAGFPRYSRMVSAALSRSSEQLPWHRVVRSNRTLAFDPGSESYRQQAQLLKQEGVVFDGLKLVTVTSTDNLDRILWGPVDE